MERAPLSARALYAILADSRSLGRQGCDERAMDALLRRVLRDLPGLGRDLFGAAPETVFDHWWGRYADINGGPVGASVPTHMIEVKTVTSRFNGDQLDRYAALAPDARCFAVMPLSRAASPDQDATSPTCKGRDEMRAWGNTSADRWEIVTWESIRDWLHDHLGDERPHGIDDDRDLASRQHGPIVGPPA